MPRMLILSVILAGCQTTQEYCATKCGTTTNPCYEKCVDRRDAEWRQAGSDISHQMDQQNQRNTERMREEHRRWDGMRDRLNNQDKHSPRGW